MTEEMLTKTFDPKTIETQLTAFWQDNNIGSPKGDGQPYCIMVPPPNVTGSLHLGHALQHAIMDTLVRHKRSNGYQVLLQPGTDHAGIATQMVVERQLNAQNIRKSDLGREAFIQKIWEWKAQSGGKISEQMKQMGVSVDWDNERFTMDPEFSKAVSHTFIQLYEQGYIYRGKRLVNWDTVLKTAVSDLEVINEERQGQIWYIKYPVGDTFITVATTRPETLLGDMAICVHPEDKRYQHLIGQQATVPLCQREIPIIADDQVDPEFGTGCVKITPAHDFNDYDIGKRHQLDMLNILNDDGSLNHNCPSEYQNLDRFSARKQMIKDLTSLGLMEKVEPHTSAVPIGDRTNTVLEPYLTDQWYIKMDALAEAALEDLNNGSLKFVPDNWKKNYQMWLDNIQDWCISRQLWWGHQIPAFYDENGNVYVGTSEEAVRKAHDISGPLTQDNDVLDTWFSSALWPFATLGWPNNSSRLDTFYPNNLLVTGFDIIFFWVARMCMFGKHFTQRMPFSTVYVTGLIRDEFGQKMSKSKGNVIDPTDLIEGATLEDLIEKRTHGMMQPKMRDAAIKATKKSFPEGISPHGTDALRLTLLALSTHTKDINFDLNKLRSSRNFCNKIWNAARFLSQQDAASGQVDTLITQALNHQVHQWITGLEKHLNDYRFDRYAQAIYEFFWYDFCDWHLEIAKVSNETATNAERMAHLNQLFDKILIVMHPALPFITEALWQDKHGSKASICSESFPSLTEFPENAAAFEQFNALKTLVSGIRNIRSELNIPPKATLDLYCIKDELKLTETFMDEVKSLAGIEAIHNTGTMPKTCCAFVQSNLEIGIDLSGHIDVSQEHQRLLKKIAKLEQNLSKLVQKTSNPKYQERAPESLKKSDTSAMRALEDEKTQLQAYLDIISQLDT